MIELIEAIPEDILTFLKGNQEDKATESPKSDNFKFLLAGVKLTLDSTDLQYPGCEDHETFARLGTDAHGTEGTLILLESKLIWFNESTKLGVSFDYQSIVLHALMNSNEAESDSNADLTSLFLQVEAGQVSLPDNTKLFEEDYDQADEDDCLTWDVSLAIEPKSIAETIFKVITDCSASKFIDQE